MKLLNIIFTFNRPKVQHLFWDSIYNCTKIRADHSIVIDDGSEIDVKNALYQSAIENKHDLYLRSHNEGYSRNFLLAWGLLKSYNPEIVSFLESDYIFRNGFMEDIFAVFDASPQAWGICGFSHPDFRDRERVKEWFGRVTTEQFGKDIKSRDSVYIPFDLETSRGIINCEYASHGCGTMFLNWNRIIEAIKNSDDPNKWFAFLENNIILPACEYGKPGTVINDGRISGGISLLWDELVNKDGDKNHAAGFINIVNSIAFHASGDGVNAKGTPECQSNVPAHNFPENYKEFERIN